MSWTLFFIGHHGPPTQLPQPAVESYRGAARLGAGIIECNLTFTSSEELSRRPTHNDLATATTHIVARDLASTCVTPESSPG